MQRQQGFTLIELVLVILILAIFAASAIPRYAGFSESRIATLNGLAGAIRASVAVVQARYVTTGATASPITMLDGTRVAVATSAPSGGIPLSTAGGIDNAVNTVTTFTYTAGAATGTYNFPTPIANCFVTYTAATGTAVVTSTGC